MDKMLAKEPMTVPMMIVIGPLRPGRHLWRAGALQGARDRRDPEGKMVHLVLGPWNHGQGRREGRGIGVMQFEGDTAGWFRRTVMQPFLDHYLKDAPQPDTPRVLAYETGADVSGTATTTGRGSCESGCAAKPKNLYLRAEGQLGFDASGGGEAGFRRIPLRSRRSLCRTGTARRCNSDATESTWGEWLMDDQRQAASRPDVLVYETEPLTEPVRVAGEPLGEALFASTTRQRRRLGREDHRRVARSECRTARSWAAISR